MTFFSKLKDAASTAIGTTINSAKENSKLIGIQAELTTVQADLDASYISIGRKYVDFILVAPESATASMPDFGVNETLIQIEPKLVKKKHLEEELARIEKELGDNAIMQEKALYEKEFLVEKEKLDKAKKMGVISDTEYNEKILKFRKKLDNFSEIRRMEKQRDMGIISREEFEHKMFLLK